ncbi:hypothetical protein [Aidingimonas halophila]|uniref:Uncharacterized protein n=1 Tax=Aidingimonas halophila TaxID=574349 RepID=A0A1H2RNW9_9GAMM|nr:hypothetical protein [Aidingimonas halophila]GHC18925.1 hypothetical protein GCM10008094_06010 [Aidingimonas halophila]SDW21146.1 hypothetical protein SAMN05443545_101373 [Aidingimonas halophila]
MNTDLDEFEKQIRREIDDFQNSTPQSDTSSQPGSSRRAMEKTTAERLKTGHIVQLAVRKKQLEMDTVFEHHSSSISKLEAQVEAEKAARAAGYPIVGHLIDIKRL